MFCYTIISSSKALISFTVAYGSSKTSFDLFIKVWWPLSPQERSDISLFFAIAQGNFSSIYTEVELAKLKSLCRFFVNIEEK